MNKKVEPKKVINKTPGKATTNNKNLIKSPEPEIE